MDAGKLSQYAGQWVMVNAGGEIVGTAPQYEAATVGVEAGYPDGCTAWWVSPYAPHVMIPRWPFEPLKKQIGVRPLWLVGGAVRDLFARRMPHDWDFACLTGALALARRVADVLGGSYYPLDLQRGIGRVVVQDPGTREPVTIDIAELRGPDIESDVRGRDFTINAMALTLEGKLIDPLHGYEDLKRGCLRMTGHGAFADDPVRVIRLARLAAELGYTVDEETYCQARHCAFAVQKVAPERVRDELLRALLPEVAPYSLKHLFGTGVLRYVLPEVADVTGIPSSSAALRLLADLVPRVGRGQDAEVSPNYPCLIPYWNCIYEDLLVPIAGGLRRRHLLSWGMLFALVDDDGSNTVRRQLVRHRLSALRFPKRARAYVETLATEAPELSASLVSAVDTKPSRRQIYRFFRRAGDAGLGTVVLSLALALSAERVEGQTDMICRKVRAYLDAVCCARDQVIYPRPLLRGEDLMALGVKAGPDMGRILAKLQEDQAVGEIVTREEARRAVLQWLQELALDDETSPRGKPR